MTRHEFPRKVKVAAFEQSGGLCDKCTAELFPGNIEYDHRVPVAMGGESTLENCEVLCKSCHKAKSAGADIPNIARAKRREAKHIGAKARSARPLPGGKGSKWKKKLTGEVVPR